MCVCVGGCLLRVFGFIATNVALFILEVGAGIKKYILKCFLCFILDIIEDFNPWGPWQIIVKNIPLFQSEFFELFSAQVWIQGCAKIIPDAKSVFRYSSVRGVGLLA